MRPIAAVAIVGFALVQACSNSDASTYDTSVPDAGSADATDAGADVVQPPAGCDPAAEPKDAPKRLVDDFFVFVDATSGTDANPGTKESPVKSIAMLPQRLARERSA